MTIELIRISLLIVACLALVATGIIRRPGIGILLTLAIAIYLGWSQGQGLAQFGFRNQPNWILTIALALAIGTVLALFALILIEPLAERITGKPHDIEIVADVRGNFKALIRWLIIVWLLVGFLEEFIFRGYIMTEILRLGESLSIMAILALIISSVVFGFSHLYQGPSGLMSSTIIGLMIGIVFVISGQDLWLVILIHGFIDTIELIVISVGKDDALRNLIFSNQVGR